MEELDYNMQSENVGSFMYNSSLAANLKALRLLAFRQTISHSTSIGGVTSAVNNHQFGLKKYNSASAFVSTFIHFVFLLIT